MNLQNVEPLDRMRLADLRIRATRTMCHVCPPGCPRCVEDLVVIGCSVMALLDRIADLEEKIDGHTGIDVRL